MKTQNTNSYGTQQNSARRKIHDIPCVHLKNKNISNQ